MGVMQHDPFIPKITGIFSSLPNIKSLHDGDSEYGCLVLMPSKHLRENPRYSMFILQLGKLVSGPQFSKNMIPAIIFSHVTFSVLVIKMVHPTYESHFPCPLPPSCINVPLCGGQTICFNLSQGSAPQEPSSSQSLSHFAHWEHSSIQRCLDD